MGDHIIGFGKPPQHSQFKAGKSGNPKGRPKGRISTARLLEKHMDAKVAVNIGGKPKKVSRREALVLSVIGDAFKGNEKVRRNLLDLVLTFDMQAQVEAASGVDAAEDQAVVDALLYSYGVKSAAGASLTSGAQKPKSTGTSDTIKKGSKPT